MDCTIQTVTTVPTLSQFIDQNNQYTSHLIFISQTGDDIEGTVYEPSRPCG